MSDWARTKDIYLDVSKAGGKDALVDSDGNAATLAICQADAFPVRLRFLTPAATVGGTPTRVELGATDTIYFSIKARAGLRTATLLAYESTWTAVTEGASEYYEGTVDLNTTQIVALLSQADSIDVVVEVEVRNAGNSERTSLQFGATLYHQVYDGESTPVPSEPTYPAAEDIVIKIPTDGSGYRFKDGEGLQLLDRVTEKWRTVFLENGVLSVGEEEA